MGRVSSIKCRLYVWGDGTGWRIPKAVFDNGSRHRFPQLASSRQRAIQAIYEHDETATRLVYLNITGHFIGFGADGEYDQAKAMEEVADAFDTVRNDSRIDMLKNRPIPNLGLIRELQGQQKAYDAKNRWTPTEADMALVVRDLLERPLPILKPQALGPSPVRALT
jgi:hypothetical protein